MWEAVLPPESVVHTSGVVQATPHWPQFPGSDPRSMQLPAPPQLTNPVRHWQPPPWQTLLEQLPPVPQSLPQEPQLAA